MEIYYKQSKQTKGKNSEHSKGRDDDTDVYLNLK